MFDALRALWFRPAPESNNPIEPTAGTRSVGIGAFLLMWLMGGVRLKRFPELRRVVHEPPHFISSQPPYRALIYDADAPKVVGYYESRDLVSALIDHALSFFCGQSS